MPLLNFSQFVAGTRAKSSDVNDNFAAINAWLQAGSIEQSYLAEFTGAIEWNISSPASKAISVIQNSSDNTIDILQGVALAPNGAILKITDNANESSAIAALAYINMTSASASGRAVRVDYGGNVNFTIRKDVISIPSRTTTQRNSVSSPIDGEMLYNSDRKAVEVYDGTNWVNIAIPPGVVVPYAGSSAPAGWLLCDGQTVTAASHPALHAILIAAGSPYGTDAGNPKVPDMRGRVAAGKNTGTFSPLGQTLGSEHIQEHQHSHSISGTFPSLSHRHHAPMAIFDLPGAVGHFGVVKSGNQVTSPFGTGIVTGSQLFFNYDNSGFGGGDGGNTIGSPVWLQTSAPVSGMTSSVSGSVNNVSGVSVGASGNIQPSLVLNYIIKV